MIFVNEIISFNWTEKNKVSGIVTLVYIFVLVCSCHIYAFGRSDFAFKVYLLSIHSTLSLGIKLMSLLVP